MNTQNRPLNVLLAFDGSSHSLAAIELLLDLPLPEQSLVTVLGVLIPRESSNHAFLENALQQAEGLLKQTGIKIQTELVLGYPAEKIIEYADQIHPNLIVAGAKGLRHTLGILLGGVAQQIVEYAKQPVLVVRAPYKKIKNVLVVTDGSQSSQAALEYLAGAINAPQSIQCECFPLPAGAQISVMHVLPPIPTPEMLARSWSFGPDAMAPVPVDHQVQETLLKEEEQRGKAVLLQAVGFLEKCAGIKATSLLVRGDAATEIIEYTKAHPIELIVAGSRGLSEIQGWLLGSVSRKLVHYSDCSVLIVKRHPAR